MLRDIWIKQIESQLPFAPTIGQHEAIDVLGDFLADRSQHVLMILRGSAGTGKTSVARAIVSAMRSLKQKTVLLAPTGRAAKVFSLGTAQSAYTIHRHIYRQKTFVADGGIFNLNDNLHTDTLFMVDEASMISTDTLSPMSFGSGNLLDDLVKYVYSGRNCRMMFIGDVAQLPPVGCDEAPALQTLLMEGYGIKVYEYDLNEVLRQSANSGILFNATVIRQMITHDEVTHLPRIRFNGFADICIVQGNELIDALSSSYSQVGRDETIVVTRSNKRSNIFNQGIRARVLDREELLEGGDHIMIVKNNYFWQKNEKEGPAFLANGDRCVVQRIRNTRQFYGFTFADAWLKMPDYDDYELQATLILDTLSSDTPALTHEQQEHLFNCVMEDYSDISLKTDRIKQLKEDKLFNALQIKYGYAVTCHKAQGGQWCHVYIDQGYMTDDMLTPDYIHWLYTAFTRATEKLYLVNWPDTQIEK